jgi:hypothetical protein
VSWRRRATFVDVVRALPTRWIANEAPELLAYDSLPSPPGDATYHLLALDGVPLAWTRGHGEAIHWIGPSIGT